MPPAITNRVRELRLELGWTQQQLARELGVTQPRIAQVESASANVQIDTLDRLAAVFGVEPAGLLQPGKPSAALCEEPEFEPAVAG